MAVIASDQSVVMYVWAAVIASMQSVIIYEPGVIYDHVQTAAIVVAQSALPGVILVSQQLEVMVVMI